jgi:hypothetical protein
MKLTIESAFDTNQTVYFLKHNKLVKSKITSIIFPKIWTNNKGEIERGAFRYQVKGLTRADYGNSEGLSESLLFPTKESLLKSL